jgi:hypothetical protein
MAAAGCNIHLASDYGFDAIPVCLLIEIDGSKHIAVVSYGHGGHVMLFRFLQEIFDTDCSV